MLKFDWLRAGPYACVRNGVWTGWTSVHNNKGKRWLFVVLLVWVYNKALINLEFGPYGKYLLWRHAARTSLRSVRTAWRHNKYFRVWTALSVNKSILLPPRKDPPTDTRIKNLNTVRIKDNQMSGDVIKTDCCYLPRSQLKFINFEASWWRSVT